MRRGDLSINMIIVAIIALVVLIVIVAIFVGKARLFGSNVYSCTNKGGTCEVKASDCTGQIQYLDCPSERPVCCTKG